MSDNNGVVITPVNVQYVGGSGSGGTIVYSGSTGPVTGASAFYVNNGLDVQGFISNSLGSPVIVSGGMQVLGNLIFNSSSLTSSGAQGPPGPSGAIGPTGSFSGNYSGTLNLTGTLNVSNNAIVSGTVGVGGAVLTSSAPGTLILTGSALPIFWVGNPSNGGVAFGLGGYTLLNIVGNVSINGALNNNSTPQAAYATYRLWGTNGYGLGGPDIQHTSLYANNTASLNIDSNTNVWMTGALNVSGAFNNPTLSTFTGSVNAFSASHNAFSASVNAYTASLTSNLDARYVSTASFNNTQVTSMVTGNLDTRYAAFGSTGGGGSGGTSNVFTGSLKLSQSLAPSPVAGFGQAYVSQSSLAGTNLYVQDPRGSITPAGGYDPVYPRIIEEEFLFSNNNGNTLSSNGLYWPYFSLQGSGTGASVTPAIASTAGHPGIVQLSTGTTATGYIEMYISPSGIRAAAGEIDCTWIVQVPTLSDATNTFTTVLGLGNTVTAGSMTQGLYFTYGSAVNGGKWQCATIGSTADSGVTVVAGTWYTLRVLLDSTASNGYFFINGALVSTITTNLPNGTLGPLAYILKSASTTARTMQVDYFALKLSGFSRA